MRKLTKWTNSFHNSDILQYKLFWFCIWILFLVIMFSTYSCKSVSETKGTASFYHSKFNGRKTARGDKYYPYYYTCASNRYSFGTILRVTNIKNNKSIYVIVNDTGDLYGRTLDLSSSAFDALANFSEGVIDIKIEVIKID